MSYFKYSFILIITLILSIQTGRSQDKKMKYILYENFTDNSFGWDIKLNSRAHSYIRNGKYFLEIKSNDAKGGAGFGGKLSFDDSKPFVIEAEIYRYESSGSQQLACIYWGGNKRNMYSFCLYTEDKKYDMHNVFNENYSNMIKPTRSPYIRSGNSYNNIKIVKENGTYTIFLNGNPVNTAPFSSFYGDKIGFMLGGKQKVAVSEFKVATPRSSSAPNKKKEGSEWKGNGSGFFISKEGHICTNYHVVSDVDKIEVEFERNERNRKYPAKLIQADKENDLAILKIKDSSFKPFSSIPYNFSSQTLDVGSRIFTLGYPMALTLMGNDIKFTEGRVSSQTGYEGSVTMYQVSAPVQEGNSGGPLFNRNGDLVGITTAKIRSNKAENVSYAIKSTYLRSLIDVIPTDLTLPKSEKISEMNLKKQIKTLDNYVTLVKVK